MRSQTVSQISRKLNFWFPKWPRCLNFWKIWLAPLWRRITLKEHRYMLYESFNVTLEARRMATHASAWQKWEKWVRKPIRMTSFCQFFQFFPEGPGSLKMMLDDVFRCPGAPGTFLEWFWINFRTSIFSYFFFKISTQNDNLWFCFSIYLLHRFEVWSMQSELKYYFEE